MRDQTLRAPGLRPYVVRNRMLYQHVTSIPPGFYLRGESGLHSDIEIPFDLQVPIHCRGWLLAVASLELYRYEVRAHSKNLSNLK